MQHEGNKKPAMEVRNLSFSYGKNRVLKDTSFQIEEGKITTIMPCTSSGTLHTCFLAGAPQAKRSGWKRISRCIKINRRRKSNG